MQEQIEYQNIIDLGFKVEETSDTVFFKQYGYELKLFTLSLTNLIYIDWDQSTRMCQMIRLKDRKDCNIVGRMEIENLQHLVKMIEFFKGKPKNYDYSLIA